MRFIGDYTAKTDAKGRVFLPVAFRKVLEAAGESRMVLRTDLFQPCLVLYPESVWNATIDDLKLKLSPYKREHQNVLRQYVADAEPIELDNSGRILITKRKLEFAGITSDVRFLALDERIEVWNKEALEKLIEEESSGLGDTLEALLG
ncbi:MAG: division/cell wall cluster transcriptional repressor MraZ [Bacteroidaceae bacterium]|nr:division/cell wall cluster transcriptional repressor MraZ [Bacteroidaceae bacterium]